MTTTESPLFHFSTLEWFRAACRQLATHPPTRRSSGQGVAGAALRTAADASTRMTPVSLHALKGRTEPDPHRGPAAGDIPAEDWDLLFRAALEFLAQVAVEKPAPVVMRVRLQAPGIALRECIDALDRLRRSVPRP